MLFMEFFRRIPHGRGFRPGTGRFRAMFIHLTIKNRLPIFSIILMINRKMGPMVFSGETKKYRMFVPTGSARRVQQQTEARSGSARPRCTSSNTSSPLIRGQNPRSPVPSQRPGGKPAGFPVLCRPSLGEQAGTRRLPALSLALRPMRS